MSKFSSFIHQNKWAANALSFSIALLVYLVFSHIYIVWDAIKAVFGFFYPVILGAVIAYVMHPLVLWFQRIFFYRLKSKKAQYNVSILCAIVLVVVILIFILSALIPQLIQSLSRLINHSDYYISNISKLTQQLAGTGVDVDRLTKSLESGFTSISAWISDNLDTIMNTTISLGTKIINWIIGCLVAIYILAAWDSIRTFVAHFFRAVLSHDVYKNASSFWHRCSHIFTKYIVCDLLDGCIIGVSNYVFMMIVGMPYAVLVSIIVGVTNLMPTIGPVIGGAVGAVILILESPWHALLFLIFTVILQTIDGYVIKPKMFGALLGVSGLLILIFIIVGGRMFGVVGVLLAIPLAAIASFVYKENILPSLENIKKIRS